MAYVSDKFHNEKLKKYNINIKTKYIVGNNILERNTDNSINDDINNGIICEKKYYISNKNVHNEKLFDSRMEYTFITNEQDEQEFNCPNCGMTSKQKDFIDGCPYCKSQFNIEYIDKDLGSKYHYDRVLRDTRYRIITAFVDLIISIILAFFFIKNTSRTFNSYDISKIFIYGIILALILYYFFYIIDAYIILSPIKRYKDKQNQKQIDFWNRTKIDKKTFFNNLNYEIRKKYYNMDNIIDYDILDYLEFNEFVKNNQMYVTVKVDIRLISYENGKIISKYSNEEYTIKKTGNITNIEAGTNVIKCHNCGATVDITKEECDYCHTKVTYLQEWIMENI